MFCWKKTPFEYKGCLDIIQPDVTHAGGIGEVKKAAEYAALNGISVAPHVFRSGASFAAHLHLLSAIPKPNPLSEKTRQRILYSPAMHDYSTDLPELRELKPGHEVYCKLNLNNIWKN